MDMFASALPALSDAWQMILQPAVLGYLVLGVVSGWITRRLGIGG